MRDGAIRRFVVTMVIALGSWVCGLPRAEAAPSPEPVTLTADDGVSVYGTYTAAAAPKALILLFHQAGSGKGEYATIAPRLAEDGYASLAIDQRAGGALFGRNQTVDALKKPAAYLDAKRDLGAALDWAARRNLPIVLWGSSYSAALVFLLAAENPGKVAAVMAFSPGEFLGSGSPVRTAAAQVDVPIFVTSAEDTSEIAAARSILAASPTATKVQFIPVHGGIHGSSTLIAARNRSGSAAAWHAVLAFLENLSRSR